MSICLIGFMGSGKTTIGQALSETLQMRWHDLDQYIEIQENQKISEIFKEKGEAYFRNLEQQYLSKLIREEGVLSTGGGVVISPANRKALKKAKSIYLAYPFETLYERIAGDETRPLATSYEALKKRFEERLDWYEAASGIKINCQNKRVDEIVQEIITCLDV